MDRRELLATFLGLPFALSGCGRGEKRIALPPGEIVGASHAVGHRLRGGRPPSVPEDRWSDVEVAIVGGGVAGLSAARRLVAGGIDDLAILELEHEPGGTSRSGRTETSPHPWGAHYVPAPTRDNPALVELFEELGVFEGTDAAGDPIVGERFRCRDPRERVFHEGHWYEGLVPPAGLTDDDRAEFERFHEAVDEWVGWRDAAGRRAFTIPVSRCSDDPEVTALDRITMGDWLAERGFASERLRWYVDLACRDDYGLRVDATSAWAGLFYFAARQTEPGGDSRPFITWPEGNGRIVEHLRRPLADRFQSGWAVVDVNPAEDGVELTAVSHAGDDVRGLRTKRVVFAAPRFLAPYVLRPWRDDPPPHVGDFEYGAWMVANLVTKEPLNEPDDANMEWEDMPMAWDNVLFDSPSLGYVSATHQRGIDHGPSVLTYYLPLSDADPKSARRRLLETDRDAWAEVVLSDLERPHPDIREKCSRLDVMRWGHAMILPRPGFVWGPSRRAATEPYRGVHFAHSDLSGIALFEEAFDHGHRAAEEILTTLRAGDRA